MRLNRPQQIDDQLMGMRNGIGPGPEAVDLLLWKKFCHNP
jgi:hypothetical protein